MQSSLTSATQPKCTLTGVRLCTSLPVSGPRLVNPYPPPPQVLAKIPWYCHTGNVLMLALQLHWFALMARGAVRVLRSGDARQDIKEE